MRNSKAVLIAVLFAGVAAFAPGGAIAATDYPTRAITIIVPYPAGGGVDAMARVVGQKLSDAFKQPVNVENRGGGGGTIGYRAVSRAAPDGYTLLLGHTG